ncbi:glucans biosynthesis glucosyltransferase MdoH [Phenylobacterium sp.]|uniref:glucans biosynthesis glucosyltransferase MdoH n=1 Tax=Phenylobacterium sp. TaxID=1871053 RepID=UPI002F91DA4F
MEPALQTLPGRAALEMPIQSLERDAVKGARARFADSHRWRRILLLGATGASTAAAAAIMTQLLAPKGFSPADGLMLALFVVLFAWVAFAFVSGTAGFLLAWRARAASPLDPQPIIFTRTALLMPTYNEDPGRILSGAQAIYEELDALGVAELYDIYVLSDTRDAAIAQAEATGVVRLRLRLGAPDRIFYRRRALNRDRKAGNIADWVIKFGAGYESMIILDADSLMTGDTIVRLTAAMERDEKAGLIQTLPNIIGATTPFARLQQFAGRIYGPIIARGQDWWSGAEGNYWGHNAIIRTRAFAECAGLPHVKGGKPFGGHIMSHDFVEAALLRRGGWAVRMAPELTGSYEEAPPSLVDMAVRDRRWCQGNLQHSAILGARGFHWVSRLHLARGVLAYLTAPLWLAFLAAGAFVWFDQRGAIGEASAPMALGLFVLTMVLLLIPKVMGALVTARDRVARQACGGRIKMGLSVVTEVALSALMAPIFMFMHSVAVADVLRGRHSGWAAQQRDDGKMKLKDAWKRHGIHTLLGLGWTVAAYRLDPLLLAWTSPLAVGLVLSMPISMLTSRGDLGRFCERLGLFRIPEEVETPRVIRRAVELRARYAAEAEMRFQIDLMFRSPAEVYRPKPQGVQANLRAAA